MYQIVYYAFFHVIVLIILCYMGCGIDSISSNVHNLCHLVDDVKHLGYLPSISTYPFGNIL